MNEPHCSKKELIVAALHGNSPDAELFDHARSCPACLEVLRVTEFLHAETSLMQHELQSLPSPAAVWRKAQASAREKALARATLPIRIARISASVVAVVAAPWLMLGANPLQPWIATLWPGYFSSVNPLWLADLNGMLLLAISGTLVCFGLSSWYMLRED